MSMSPAKRRAKAHRAAVRAHQSDPLTDAIKAAAGDATRACASCTLQHAASTLDERGVCTVCNTAAELARSARSSITARAASAPAEPDVVFVDASYRDGHAGLAITGALGQHTRSTPASSSTHAELLALQWATRIARERELTGLTFRTDSAAAYQQMRDAGRKLGWTIEQIPRERNHEADALAYLARTRLPEPH